MTTCNVVPCKFQAHGECTLKDNIIVMRRFLTDVVGVCESAVIMPELVEREMKEEES